MPAVGTKRQVWNGTANHTSGGLYQSDLMQNDRGLIVSKRKHKLGGRRKNVNALSAWVSNAQDNGYMVAGHYKKLPKRGTAAYKKLLASYRRNYDC